MAPFVTISEENTARLDRLQAAIRRETGATVTQRELLDRMVERQFTSKEALVDSFREDFDGRSDEETAPE